MKMKPLCSRTIFICSSRIRSAFNPEIRLYYSYSPSASRPWRRSNEEDGRNVRVSVWWDFENCSLPANTNVFRVAQSITAAIRANGIKGPVQITAFGDVQQLSRSNQEALSFTGIILTHIPHGGKNSADRSLLMDLMYWVSQNPPPAHVFLISGDKDFASTLHRLRMNNYNILLASPESASGVLCSAASIMWQWNGLVSGENLTGKHFNHPPDGPYGSSYGQSRLPLEDPFVVHEPGCLLTEETSESNSDTKPRPVPKEVVKMIRHILNSYPKGLSITDLRLELNKRNVTLEKDLYGYKKFSRFLSSMPHVLKLEFERDGQFLVRGIGRKVPESSKFSEPGDTTAVITTAPTDTKDKDFSLSSKINGGYSSCTGAEDEKSLPLSPKINMNKHPTELPETPKIVEQRREQVQNPPPPVKIESNDEVTQYPLRLAEESSSIPEVGVFKRIWRTLFRGKDNYEEKGDDIVGKYSTSRDSIGNNNAEAKSVGSTGQSSDPVSLPSSSSSSNEVAMEEEIDRSSGANDGKSGKGPSFLNQIMHWCKFWGREQGCDNVSEQYSEKQEKVSIDLEKFPESFWSDMLAFLETPRGSDIILQSRTRKEMVQNLQKRGPSTLRSLSESDLLQLVGILVSEKQWVEECSSLTFPFRLNLPAGKSSSSNTPGSKELRSIFLDTKSKGISQGHPENDGEKKRQNVSHTGVPSRTFQNKPSSKTRSHIIGDCQRLVNEILKEYPHGFNMGSFRKLFLDRYGYSLDIHELGYQKLATLLQIMPGVKIESTFIFPSGRVSKHSSSEIADPNVVKNNADIPSLNMELSDVSRKDDGLDSPWEELGPVANLNTKRYDEKRSDRKVEEETVGQIPHDFETLSDNDFSDSEEESPLEKLEGQGKPRTNEEDSSLIQILDSWYSSKEDNSRKIVSGNAGGMGGHSSNVLKPSSLPGVGIKSDTAIINCGQKQRSPKQYLFVAEKPEDNEDKLIDGILGSLKKSGDDGAESRIQDSKEYC